MSEARENEGLEEPSGVDVPDAPEFQLGGQALVEGVMMRSPRFVAAAVRHPDGHIQTHVEPFVSVFKRKPHLNIPLLRGTFALIEMLVLGMKFLQWSSNIALEEKTKTDDGNAANGNAANGSTPDG